ncbi:hypothetical protein Tco_0323270 [Tanacetum coccineum]
MHNNIMAAGSKDRPPMLGPGRYSQWRSRFLRYIDTKPNGEGLRKSILSGPYVPSTVLVQAVAATEGNPAIQQHTTIETVLNMTPENKEHFLSEKEAIFLLLTGIGDDIYSTVDACKTTNEMWIAIERLQQGESLNVQDVKTNLFWEFGKFTSRDGESMESYYSRFYKLMNELTRNNLQVTTMQVNVQFLQQLQPECASTRHKGTDDRQPLHLNLSLCLVEDNDLNKLRGIRICKRIWHSLQSISKGSTNLPTTTFKLLQTPGTRMKIPHHGIKNELSVQGSLGIKGQEVAGLEKKIRQSGSATNGDTEVLPKESSSTKQPLEHVQNNDENNVFANKRQHFENNTTECADERAALANLIANLTLDTEENKTILKQLKKANTLLTQEIEECKTNLDETSRALGEATSCRNSCLIAL